MKQRFNSNETSITEKFEKKICPSSLLLRGKNCKCEVVLKLLILLIYNIDKGPDEIIVNVRNINTYFLTHKTYFRNISQLLI